jgi:hypothetical protein
MSHPAACVVAGPVLVALRQGPGRPEVVHRRQRTPPCLFDFGASHGGHGRFSAGVGLLGCRPAPLWVSLVSGRVACRPTGREGPSSAQASTEFSDGTSTKSARRA